MQRKHLSLIAPLLFLTTVVAQAAAPPLTPTEIVAQAPASAWQTIPAENLLVMTLSDGRRINIELAPHFAPAHVSNVVRLAQNHAWDRGEIVRSQDNYVAQWKIRDEAAKAPKGFIDHPPAEYDIARANEPFRPLGFTDSYAPEVGFLDGWAVGSDNTHLWPAQCYGMIGVARDVPPDTGNGQELYVVNGEAPRQLDRNLAVIGRVVSGMEILSALPRGKGPLGFYTNPHENIRIQTVRLSADLPPAQQLHIQTLKTNTPTFDAYLAARAARTDPFFVYAAHGVALCNVPIPSREIP
ncbi:peptidylprolyl isomerase [Neokomagataea tanensis]|uniref:peptidylprolyl isomerase n=1 Tax=Neokomagataea tanensis TaxID=661191 RepID=A0A4Y6V495_9PROT|nr:MULTISPECIES: peptidylprolyl isomerase [Neokomagataea]QDH24889.1 peptidylprolyl isomerase [Neokomagataea tanensis]